MDFLLLNYVNVRTKKSSGPSPLRTVSGSVQFWPKSIKFVRDESEQQQGSLPEDKYSVETSLY